MYSVVAAAAHHGLESAAGSVAIVAGSWVVAAVVG